MIWLRRERRELEATRQRLARLLCPNAADSGHPLEPISDLVARAERLAEQAWREEHDPMLRPRPNPSVPTWQ